jgi:hypothetical protein
LICAFCEYVVNKLPAKPAMAAAITTATATNITVAITGEIAFLEVSRRLGGATAFLTTFFRRMRVDFTKSRACVRL